MGAPMEERRAVHFRVSGRDQAVAAPHGALALQRAGDLSARADLQRVGCQRSAAVRKPRAPRAARERSRARHPRDRRSGATLAQRHGQRHRHEPRGSHRPSRHDRPFRHGPVPRAPHRRSAQGCTADRPVRRRLLFGIHRRRRSDGADPPRRRAGRPRRVVGLGRARRVSRRGRRAARSAARRCSSSSKRTPTSSLRPERLEGADSQVLRPYRVPGSPRGRRTSQRKRSIAARRCGRGRERDQRRRVRRVLQGPGARQRRRR